MSLAHGPRLGPRLPMFTAGEASAVGGEFIKVDVPLPRRAIVIDAVGDSFVLCPKIGCRAYLEVPFLCTGRQPFCPNCREYR